MLVSTIVILCDVHRYAEAELLVDSAMEFYSFYDSKPRRKELEFLGLSATILDRNYYKAYNYIRFTHMYSCSTSQSRRILSFPFNVNPVLFFSNRLMLMENVDLPQLWNIFNQVCLCA